MKYFIICGIGVVLFGSCVLAKDMKPENVKYYVDGQNSIKRELTLEDRKKLLKDTKALNKENVHKTKSYLGK